MRLKNRDLELLEKGLVQLEIKYDSHVLDQFEKYLGLLHQYKDRIHLISHKDYSRISLKHFLPSAMVLRFIGNQLNACDLGAGAGFPSIPIKILKPEIKFVLFESKKKIAKFLREVINTLNLKDIEVVNERAERYEAGKFDLVLIRAAGRINKLIKVISHLLRPEGTAILYKTSKVNSELKMAEKLLKKKNLQISCKYLSTPIDNQPLVLVFLRS